MRSLVVAMMVLAGCGGDVCGGNDDVDLDADTSPRLEKLSLLDDAVRGDPWELVFVAKFTDKDADLVDGRALVYLNDNATPTKLELREIYRQSAVPDDATSGSLTLPLRFNDTVPDGSDVRLSAQLVDDASHRSNCYSLDLHFDVEDLAARAWRTTQRLAALWYGATPHG